MKNKVHKFNVTVSITDKNFKETGLKLQSTIKVVKIATLDKAVILGKIGELDSKNMSKVKNVFKIYLRL